MRGRTVSHVCRSLAASAFALASAFVCAAGLSAESRDIPSNLQVWGRGDGLPVNAVISLAQSRAGDLWVGTANGLSRFDGQKWTVFTTAHGAKDSGERAAKEVLAAMGKT